MSWLLLVLYAWLWSFVAVPPVLYVGYGFVMAAMRARDLQENPSPPWVVKLDSVIATFFILLDGYYNFMLCAVFLRWPEKYTITVELPILAQIPGLRGEIAIALANFLNWFAPSGEHVRLTNNLR